jgi:hypothetical protein
LCRHIGLAFADVTRRFADAPDTQHTLRKLLAAAIDLHAQVKQAHWNVRGPSFIAIHELFDKVSTEVENYSDLIAERAGGLGGTALARSKQRLSALFSSPIRLASRTSRNTYLPFRERSPHSANPHERPSIKRQPSEMPIPPICSPKSRGASTINYGSSDPPRP